MPWVRIDDHFDEHPKIAAVGPLGIALWVTGLAYCNRNLTDGFIPWSVARNLLTWEYLGAVETDGRRKRYRIAVSCGMVGDDVASEEIITLLVESGMWDEADGGYRVHDFDQYQPSKETVLAEREASRVRMGRSRSKQTRSPDVAPEHRPNIARSSPEVQEKFARSSPAPVPDPVPPDPSDQETHTARAKRIDEGFLAQIAMDYPDFTVQQIAEELAKAKNKKSWDTFKDHRQAFRNWMKTAREIRQRDGNRGSGQAGVRGSGPYGGASGGGGVRTGTPSGSAPPRVPGFDSTGIRRIGGTPAETRAG